MSVRKIIIRHGERVTEHEVSERPLVVGRDPQCDLFFADKKLSRRHARFERDGDGVRLVDLGSRNGSWVNEEPVEDRLLGREDTVRLGSLQITLEYAPAPGEADDAESTVLLAAEPSPDDSSTVILSPNAKPDAEAPGETAEMDASPEEAGTVMLSPNATPEDSGTVMLSPNATPEDSGTVMLSPNATPEDSGTVMLSPDALPPPAPDEDQTMERARDEEAERVDRTVMLPTDRVRQDPDTGTVIYNKVADPSFEEAATRMATAKELAEASELSEPKLDDVPSVEMMERASRPSGVGSLRFFLLVVAVAALAVAVLALPIVRTLGSALAEEASLRGRALVDLLAATNANALRDNRPEALSLARITGEPGVVGVYILDPAGRMLAPRESSDAESTLAELGTGLADIRTFRRIEAPNGDVVMVKPILVEGRRLGLAILRYSAPGTAGLTTMMLLLGSILLIMGVAFAVLLARRWTLLPVVELRDDVAALREGFAGTLPEERPYSELSDIAKSFNELLRRRETVDKEEAASSMAGASAEDPTFIPGDRR